jgi:hypothetical protein
MVNGLQMQTVKTVFKSNIGILDSLKYRKSKDNEMECEEAYEVTGTTKDQDVEGIPSKARLRVNSTKTVNAGRYIRVT